MTLLDYIKAEGLSFPELARRCRCAVSTVWRVAHGERMPTLPTAAKIQRGTGGKVSMADMLLPRRRAKKKSKAKKRH